jgi:diguanylate cyclase (GGDEF)-like protein
VCPRDDPPKRPDRLSAALASGSEDRTLSARGQDRVARENTARDRHAMAQRRQEAVLERARVARARDATARARDQAAHLRDRIAEARDGEATEQDGWSEALCRESSNLAVLRKQAARDRARAAADRKDAADDRERARRVRQEFVCHRREAARERAQAAHARESAETDTLTGTRAKGAGVADLRREIDRARRTTDSLAVAFVDVDGGQQVNDAEDRLAGDRLLATVAGALRDGLRSYDLIIRFGGHEFVCALSGLDTDEVARRFGELAEELAADSTGPSVSIGFAQLQDGDDTAALIARAEHAHLQARRPN